MRKWLVGLACVLGLVGYAHRENLMQSFESNPQRRCLQDFSRQDWVFKPKKNLMQCLEASARIEYVEEVSGKDYWQSPAETERLGTGDCEDKAWYLHALMNENGINSRLVIGRRDVCDEKMHLWVEAEIKGELHILDPTERVILRRKYIEENAPCLYEEERNHPEIMLWIIEMLKEYMVRNKQDDFIRPDCEAIIEMYKGRIKEVRGF